MMVCVCDLGPGVHSGPTRHVGTHRRVGPQSEVSSVVAEALSAAAATQVPLGCHTQGACLLLFVCPMRATSGPLNACVVTPLVILFFFLFRVRCKTHVSGWSWKTGRGKRTLHVGFVGF